MRPQRRRAASTIAARGGLVGNLRFERKAFATRLSCHCDRFLGGGEVVVDCQHLGAFLCKAQNRGTAGPGLRQETDRRPIRWRSYP